MRKALVVELKKTYAVVTEQGIYMRVTLKEGMEIGRTIIFTDEDIVRARQKVRSHWRKQLVPVMAVFALVIVLASGFYNNNYAVYSAVTIDINPSVELLLNKQDEVVKVMPLNEDAKVLKLGRLEGLSVDAAVAAIISNAKEEGFIQTDSMSYVVLTTVPLRANSEALQSSLQAKLRDRVAKVVIDENLSVAVTESTEGLLEEARAKSLPLALVNMQDKIDISDITSVKELFQNRENHRLFEENGKIYESEIIPDQEDVEDELDVKEGKLNNKSNGTHKDADANDAENEKNDIDHNKGNTVDNGKGTHEGQEDDADSEKGQPRDDSGKDSVNNGDDTGDDTGQDGIDADHNKGNQNDGANSDNGNSGGNGSGSSGGGNDGGSGGQGGK